MEQEARDLEWWRLETNPLGFSMIPYLTCGTSAATYNVWLLCQHQSSSKPAFVFNWVFKTHKILPASNATYLEMNWLIISYCIFTSTRDKTFNWHLGICSVSLAFNSVMKLLILKLDNPSMNTTYKPERSWRNQWST